MKDNIIIQPIVSEKSFALAEGANKYCFRVNQKANKMEIAKAVAEKFDVTVDNVHTLNVRARKVRSGRTRKIGKRSPWKKAIVTLAEGDKIALFEVK